MVVEEDKIINQFDGAVWLLNAVNQSGRKEVPIGYNKDKSEKRN